MSLHAAILAYQDVPACAAVTQAGNQLHSDWMGPLSQEGI